MTASPILEIDDLKVHFPVPKSSLFRSRDRVHAVDGVSLTIATGETLSLVGESGSGKTSIGRAIVGLNKPTSGSIAVMGRRLDGLRGEALRKMSRHVQFVFQDPFSSLNPRMTVMQILAEPLRNFDQVEDIEPLDRQLHRLIGLVGLPADALDRHPHEFSGGQRQRIGIARALALRPQLLVCDEAVSALDVSVKAQIVNLLMDLQRDLGIAILFISHDLAIVEHMTHRVAVLYLGKIMEIGTRTQLFAAPQHPYTRALLAAVPDVDKLNRPTPLQGEIPSPINPPSGCRFRTRCPVAVALCHREEPHLRPSGSGQMAACHFAEPLTR